MSISVHLSEAPLAMPQADPRAHAPPDWTVMWMDRRTGCVVCGEPVERAEAERCAEAMNRTWPEIHHWAAPLARRRRVGTGEHRVP